MRPGDSIHRRIFGGFVAVRPGPNGRFHNAAAGLAGEHRPRAMPLLIHRFWSRRFCLMMLQAEISLYPLGTGLHCRGN